MPWNKEIHKGLRELISESKNQEFYEKFKKIIKEKHSESTMNDYLYGNKDDKKSLLWYAANTKENVELIKYLINEVRINVNHKDSRNETPIWAAAEKGYIQNVKLLTQNGAEVFGKNILGQTLLGKLIALGQGNSKIIEQLCAEGASVEEVNEYNSTLLHLAAESGKLGNVHGVISCGGKNFLNKQNNDNETPLHYAAQSKNSNISQYLLMLGADRTIKNKDKKTAIQVAEEYDNKETQKAIRDFDPSVKYDAEAFYMKVIGQEFPEPFDY